MEHLAGLLNLTFEGPFEYIWIIFSAPCFTFSSMFNCFFNAVNLLLVEKRGSLFGVSGVLGQSVNYRHINYVKISQQPIF